MMDQTIVVTAIPRITGEFDSIKDIGWYGSAFMLSVASLQPLMGKVYQYYSSKYTFLAGLAVFEIGSLVCALAKSSPMFIIGRAIAGAGGSGLIIGFLTILASAAPLDKRPLYIGMVMGVSSLGLVIGPVVGGVLTQEATWRWCFYLNLPFGVITGAILSVTHIPDSSMTSTTPATTKQQFARLDLPGFAIFTPACIMLLLAFDWGGVSYPWKSATIIGLFCGAVGACGIFIAWENYRGNQAMIPLAMLKRKVVIASTLTMICSQGSLLVITYYLPTWFQVVKNASPTMGGVYFLPSVGSQMLGAVLTGALTSKTGMYTPWAIGGLALTSIASGLLSTLTPTSNAGMWVGYQLISGFSRGLTMQQPLTAIQAALPKSELAMGNAFLMFAQVLGGAIFVSLGQTIFSNQLGPALAYYAPEVDAAAVFAVGATNFRSVVPASSVAGVVLAYNRAITRVFYLGVAACVAGFASSWGMGWTNLKTKKEEDEKAQEEKAAATVEPKTESDANV
ncbi:hypothetical protein G7Y89_g11074 [Cudoniella acicularis]|uniref:Major facilitator superfamily (MFS) profile domain-containing protein n=1 Tax=Cudoniella acicularis TaxID=354080 RepID=A0A8H4VYD8_9HELO|nr:hypothetical protein G7Y89_g11074 [Cudoniella acicularis]